jgi:uncharacterized repeat protein (TIGR01451 family)
MKSQFISTPSTRSSWFLTTLAIFVVLVGVIVVPFFSSSIASSLGVKAPNKATNLQRSANTNTNFARSLGESLRSHGSFGIVGYSPMLQSETVEIFAADCSTPKTTFALGETVCAKTNGVDVTTSPGNYYMNWIDSQLNQTNGGTITQNPQFFLFVPPTAGTWKATIGRVNPADSSIIGNPPLFTVSSNSPGISTFTQDCLTPKTAFTLNQIVCATAIGGIAAPRRLVWIDPSGNARQVDTITSDPQSFQFTIPATQTSLVGNDTVDNRGNWKVNMISSRGSLVATTTFVVTDPTAPTADLQVLKSAASSSVSAGSNGSFLIQVFNNGPNAAANVSLADTLPANTTFVSIVQSSGPTFSCTGTGTVTCTITSLPANERAQFELAFQVNTGTATNTVITNTATVSSDTADPDANTNSSSASVTVSSGGGGGGTCSVGCPDDIQTPANTVDENNNSGAIVHFSPPSGNLACGTITVDHCNDCFFPEGSTVVTGTAETGDSCSFTVTITPAGSAPTISCPGNKTADADANVCSTNVNVGTATATGSNVTVLGFRSDGQPMYTCDAFGNCTRSSDAPFNAGTTTITWYAYAHDVAGPYGTGTCDGQGENCDEESHRTGSATCTQTVMVNDVTAPNIAATDSTVSADANCEAAIPDYSSTVTDNCACGSADDSEACEGHPHIIYTQTPAAGTLVGIGPHTVHIEATDGSSNNNGATKDVTFTINDTTAPTVQAPADSSASADANCQAPVPDYTANSTASDNCDTSVTFTQSPAAGTLVGLGPHTVTVTATDDAGNHSSDDVIFTVNDTTAPQITCPSNITTGNDPGQCFATVNPGTATATDNCDSTPTIVGTRSDNQPLNASYPKGTTTIHWTATDDAGNSSSCNQTVTVNDTENPTISCPSNITKNNDPGVCGAVVTYTAPVGQDNCPGATTAQTAGLPSGSTFPVGTTTNTFEVTDSSGNKTSCSFTVTVNDVENPVISCPSSQTLEPTCPSGAKATWIEPVGTDNCPGAVTTRTGPAPGSVFPIGTTTVTYTVNDAHGHSASCSFTVTVKTASQTLQDMKTYINGLSSLTGTQKQGLNAKLDAALSAIANGQTNVACNKLNDFISQVQAYINNGTLTSAQGQPLIDSAKNVRNTIGCTNNPCT